MRFPVRFVALALAAGCPEPEAASPCGAPTVTLGLAEAPFETLVDGEVLALVRGPQGGWHFELAAELSAFGDPVDLTLSAVDQDSGAVVSESWLTLAPTPVDGCTGRVERMLAVFDVAALVDGERDTPPELLPGHRLTLSLAADDGTSAAEVRVEVQVASDG